jgi:hypothetical protein
MTTPAATAGVSVEACWGTHSSGQQLLAPEARYFAEQGREAELEVLGQHVRTLVNTATQLHLQQRLQLHHATAVAAGVLPAGDGRLLLLLGSCMGGCHGCLAGVSCRISTRQAAAQHTQQQQDFFQQLVIKIGPGTAAGPEYRVIRSNPILYLAARCSRGLRCYVTPFD